MKDRWERIQAACRRFFWRLSRASVDNARKPLAVFTMVYNEHRMLPLWVRYYGQQVGAENLFILDHGSDNLPELPGCHVIPLRRTELDEIDRCRQVQVFQKKLLRSYQSVLFTDCDEFLVADPARYTSLRDYAAHAPAASVRCIGVDVMECEPNLPPVQWDKPILQQRPYGAVRIWSCKTLLSSVPLTWEPGFHKCKEPAMLDAALWMFHLKYADQSSVLERLACTRGLPWSARARTLHHGESHRMPDQALLDFIRAFQDSRSECALDTLDFVGIIKAGRESNLCRIPDRFLEAL